MPCHHLQDLPVARPDQYPACLVGGPPKVLAPGGCRTGSANGGMNQQNDVGLWLFSRKPVDPESTEAMLEVLREMGLDTSVLLPVQQEGCTYEASAAQASPLSTLLGGRFGRRGTLLGGVGEGRPRVIDAARRP